MRKKCAFCGQGFVDFSTNQARRYCDAHLERGARTKALKRGAPTKPPRKIQGEPMTFDHYRRWTRRLVAKRGGRFALEPWEAEAARDLFVGMAEGWLKEDWLVVPEGNGKSTFYATLVLYALEYVAEAGIPIAAASAKQAEIVYQAAEGFVRRSPDLRGRYETRPGIRELRFPADAPDDAPRSLARIMAGDADTGDGIDPYPFEIIDELHAHDDLELYKRWAGKLDKQDAVLLVITTAGEPGSEFEETRTLIRQSATEVERRGRCFGRYRGPSYLMHEYALPEGGDHEDVELVAEANPSPRITVETLAAKRTRPSWRLAHWLRFVCNLPTRALEAAITERAWALALAPEERREIPLGSTIDLGADFAWVKDALALVPLWIPEPGFRLLGAPTVFDPRPDGTQVDVDAVKAAIREFAEDFELRYFVADPSYARDVIAWVRDELGVEVVEKPQGNVAHALDYERFMEGLRNGWLRHSGDPVMRRHVLNAVARPTESGKMRFDRPRESRKVGEEQRRRRLIDCLTAAAMVNTVAASEIDEPAGEPMIAWSFA